ncbi:MAG: exonuclease SbcCD subunit D [Candidatus Sericytochromatia bacterium]|nr:exonuclease SbcCD subunit D [Candidatus Sericytochromatia bacterium]
MKVLHTSDWHAGKLLYRQDRTPDLKFALEQMLELIEHEKVELVLVPGDLYDSFHPPAAASEVLFQFFLNLSRRNIPSLVIAGNHDSQKHWGSLKQLLSLAHVHVFDKPSSEAHTRLDLPGGSIGLTALPYPHERQLSPLLENSGNLGQQRGKYAERVAHLLALLAKKTPEADFQVLLAHLMMNGAQPGKSERALTVSDTYTVYGNALPAQFDYVALGHIHKRQAVTGSTPPAWYCGTPFMVDFAEADTEKGVLLVELEPGKSAQIQFKALTPLHELRFLEVHETELDQTLKNLRDFEGWLKLRVKTDGPRKGLQEQLHREVGKKLLQVEVLSPHTLRLLDKHRKLPLENPLEVYQAYSAAQNRCLSPELENAFKQLLEEAQS